MREYLVRTSATHEWPGVHVDRHDTVLLPRRPDCERVEGWGNYRIRCGGADISYSAEPPGWQISVDGHLDERTVHEVLDTITRQVADEVGEPCDWIQIAW